MYQARASAASVAAALQDVAALGGSFVLRVGGSDDGWHPVARSYAAGFTDLAAAVAVRHRTREPRVDVSIAQLGHAGGTPSRPGDGVPPAWAGPRVGSGGAAAPVQACGGTRPGRPGPRVSA
ncbi:hypothetical protein [Streptomyces sp. KLOTTS4A1]|uniref:hypothetical protein n=1 Tax=Streptomyces sp. KLOTTS4A1 TaxID=3390996 RepID=UPI0039F474C0